jgi:hypothetical protein
LAGSALEPGGLPPLLWRAAVAGGPTFFLSARDDGERLMNVKQTLITAGGVALLALFGWLTFKGHGVTGTEWVQVGVAGVAIVAATAGLVYAFRDQ